MRILIIVPDYPKNDRIAYQFVHNRVKQYQKKVNVDVFCYKKSNEKDYKYERVNVLIGDKKRLLEILDSRKYDKYVFHYLNNESANFIIRYLKNEKTYVWLHGTDCVSWKRRLCAINFIEKSYYNPYMLLKVIALIILNKFRLNNIKRINKYSKNNTFIFVSNWLKKTVEKDIKIKFKNYCVINNYIDLDVYKYNKKKANYRLKVLSITDYSNLTYAGDVLQNIICEFSKREEFDKFEFTLYGKGKLFKKNTKKLRNFKNVNINNTFVKSDIIRKLHDENGIFLYPKRGDSQGVSRCEAMSSGLVPIASNVEAISEFSPKETTYLTKSIDDFIKALLYVYNNPKDFMKKSKKASDFIKEKCNYENTIKKEIELLLEDK